MVNFSENNSSQSNEFKNHIYYKCVKLILLSQFVVFNFFSFGKISDKLRNSKKL